MHASVLLLDVMRRAYMLEKYLRLITGGRDRSFTPPPGGIETLLDNPEHETRAGAKATLQRFLGRQPILDDASRIVGYELKIRSGVLSPEELTEGARQQAQNEMLVIGVIDLAFQKALGAKLTFISLSPSMLDNPLLNELPAKNIVVAICPEKTDIQELVERCRELTARGIQIALEDFEYRPELNPLLELCRYVRINTRQYDALQLSEQAVALLKMHGPTLIATQVETEEAFEAYRKLSFNLFQGYYFTCLQPAAPHRMDSNRIRVMELLNLVINRADIHALEEKVKLDAALTYRLLNYINSPANGMQKQIQSIGHAITLIGYDQLYRWLTLLMFSSGKADERSRSLLKNALVRGRFCESLGKTRLRPAELGGLFIVGIFSLLDALLNIPMGDALARLNLPKPVVDALIRREGLYAPYLQLAIACENFDQDTISRYSTDCGLDADAVNVAHVNALIWSEQIEV
ncbi:diguanylate phosphodiesterase [Sulfuricella denitrificans skB26]|uniref:Diguanylate phosphodiesterase n=2 Tax=Sulfuricella denitrificans TaxID=649841 RepID=S6AAN7_SULDS|nr:diguanylate phosphodiesterase [Sulfuricella denitrificans skB26]